MEYIIDSSVIIKWYSHYDEDFRDNALSLLKLYKEGRLMLYIPELAIYEISNALRYNKNFTQPEVKDSIKFFFTLELPIVSLNQEIMEMALQIAYEDNITVYDAIFISLSDYLKIPLITSNPKHQLTDKRSNIVLLKDF